MSRQRATRPVPRATREASVEDLENTLVIRAMDLLDAHDSEPYTVDPHSPYGRLLSAARKLRAATPRKWVTCGDCGAVRPAEVKR